MIPDPPLTFLADGGGEASVPRLLLLLLVLVLVLVVEDGEAERTLALVEKWDGMHCCNMAECVVYLV